MTRKPFVTTFGEGKSMSEYEYLDLISTYREETGFHAMNFIAILFAYLVAGYFAAHLLSGFQALSATVFYLILVPMPALAPL